MLWWQTTLLALGPTIGIIALAYKIISNHLDHLGKTLLLMEGRLNLQIAELHLDIREIRRELLRASTRK